MKPHRIALVGLALSMALVLPAGSKEYAPTAVCTGTIEAPPSAFAALTEVDSLGDIASTFIGRPGAGGLCKARVYTAAPSGEGKLKVYRMFNSAGGQTWGRWWTFTDPSTFKKDAKGASRTPAAAEAEFRKASGTCASAGPADVLDKVTVCTLRVGAEFAIGPTQSKDCPAGGGVQRLPQSPLNQIFMALGSGTYALFVDAKTCVTGPSPFAR